MAIKPYDHTTYPSNGALGSSAALRNELDAIEAGFDMVATEIETALTGSETAAATATTQAGIATTQAEIATTQAGLSATQAGISTTQAGISTTQAEIATTQAANALASANSAAATLDTVNTVYDDFDDRYLGAKSADPTLDNDGDPLQEGTLYYNTTTKILKYYNGTVWVNAPAGSAINTTFTPSGNIAATNVQAAIEELDSEKADAGTVVAALTALDVDVLNLENTKLSLAGGSMAGAINEKRATVAATATTTPLWTAANGNVQDWTGTPTITDFPDAPQAGASRVIYPAAGTIITNNANISVQGNANYTVEAGDELTITAVTPTTFYVTIKKKSGNNIEPGAVQFFARNTPPAGWLKANGALVSRTTYANLFAAIGTVFGAGDGSTTFALPDLRGEFLRGWDDARGIDSGRVFGSSQLDAFQGHKHRQRDTNQNSTSGGTFTSGTNLNAERSSSYFTEEASESTFGAVRIASETRPRNIALLACIKF